MERSRTARVALTARTTLRIGAALGLCGFLVGMPQLDMAGALDPTEAGSSVHRGISPVQDIEFSPRGDFLAVARGPAVYLFKVGTCELLRTLSVDWDEVRVAFGETDVASIAFSPDGAVLAGGYFSGAVALWDAETGDFITTLGVDASCFGGVASVSYSPDGSTIAVGMYCGEIRVWNPSSHRQVRTFAVRNSRVHSTAYSPDGGVLAAGAEGGRIQILNARTGELLRVLASPMGCVLSVDFSPDGTTLASGAGDNSVRLWDVATGTCLRTLLGHTDDVTSVAYAPNGRELASASDDGTLRVWNVGTGETIRSVHSGALFRGRVAFSPDGTILAYTPGVLTDAQTGSVLQELSWNAE